MGYSDFDIGNIIAVGIRLVHELYAVPIEPVRLRETKNEYSKRSQYPTSIIFEDK